MLLYEKPRSISNIRHPRGEKNPPLSAAPAPTPLAGDAVDDDGASRTRAAGDFRFTSSIEQ